MQFVRIYLVLLCIGYPFDPFKRSEQQTEDAYIGLKLKKSKNSN